MGIKKELLVKLAVSAITVVLIGCAGGKKQEVVRVNDGFEKVKTVAAEFDSVRILLMDTLFVPTGVGIGESVHEMNARSMAADFARAELAASIATLVTRLAETYMDENSRDWEAAARGFTEEYVKGAQLFRTATEFNRESGRYRVTNLLIIHPTQFGAALKEAAVANTRIKKEDLMRKMDALSAEYQKRFER
jgi:hypothetical protein